MTSNLRLLVGWLLMAVTATAWAEEFPPGYPCQILGAVDTRARCFREQGRSPDFTPNNVDESAPRTRPAPPQAPPLNKSSITTGSGFVVAAGQVVTNSHVVENCSQIRVRLGTQQVSASLSASSQSNDLALLQHDGLLGSPAPIRTAAVLGEEITVAGFPLSGVLGASVIVTSGQVNSLAGLGNDPLVLQISAPVQSGNSGGPVVDKAGAVVGVVVSKLNVLRLARLTGEITQNVNFAIKPEVLRLFLDANSIVYRSATGQATRLDGAQIAEMAKRYTVQVECRP